MSDVTSSAPRPRVAFVSDDGHVYVDVGESFVLRYVPEAEVERLREAALALAVWTQHHPTCARANTTAESCTCGLREAWVPFALTAEKDR